MDHPFYKTIDRKGYSLEDDLNIRDQGGMEGQILTAIQKGDEVHVLGYGKVGIMFGMEGSGGMDICCISNWKLLKDKRRLSR